MHRMRKDITLLTDDISCNTDRPILVETNLQQIDERNFAQQLDDADKINNIAVFLIPGSILPEGFAASIFIQWPGNPFQWLGGIANEKPSAFFRLKDTQFLQAKSNANGSVEAILGISIVSLAEIQTEQQKAMSLVLKPKTLNQPLIDTAEAIMLNVYNFISGYATSTIPINGTVIGDYSPDKTFIPLKVISLSFRRTNRLMQAFEEWHSKLLFRIKNDPGFLRKIGT